MTQPAAVETAAISAQAVVDMAKRLGLIWTIRPATVVKVDPLTATYDGDTVPISMVNLIGPLTIGNRIMAISVPPAGNFAIGLINAINLRHKTTVETTDIAAFTNTAYDPGSPIAGLAFDAPPSGVMTFLWHARFQSNTAGGVRALVSLAVREGSTLGSGVDVLTAGDGHALETPTDATGGSNQRVQAAMMKTLTTLTPGKTYNVVIEHKVSAAGNGTIFDRSLTIIPSP